MFKQRKTKACDRGQEIWFLIPESERTAARVLDELRKEGYEVSKATVARWAKGWKAVAHKALGLIKLPVELAPIEQQEDRRHLKR